MSLTCTTGSFSNYHNPIARARVMLSRNMFSRSRASEQTPDSIEFTEYHDRAEDAEQLIQEHSQATRSSEKRGLVVTCIIQGLFFLWIPFVLTFVVLNFLSHVVGATLRCLGEHWHVELFNPNVSVPIANLKRFDKRDHNILGALQLLAKVIEIWFGSIVAVLVSLITFRIAEKDKGLPIGLIISRTLSEMAISWVQ
jgi:hypothetical protein